MASTSRGTSTALYSVSSTVTANWKLEAKPHRQLSTTWTSHLTSIWERPPNVRTQVGLGPAASDSIIRGFGSGGARDLSTPEHVAGEAVWAPSAPV